MQVALFPELDDDDMLVMRMEYQLSLETGHLAEGRFTMPRMGCPYRSVDIWLANVCQASLCPWNEGCSSCKHILRCDTCNSILICPRKGPRDWALGATLHWTASGRRRGSIQGEVKPKVKISISHLI
ncbi:hypothetical protein BDV41DRAFT_555238 [Aspergillus transmontanensis]|uniref:Uncharacterized protein n=1 Tax=Aspergillus transmontanensis TaxID=1034304 RepID=A0A5N6VGD0_9EURO|nr:hypothetical protein BDV41DRAFT_555238 [Aspergillus transmontanensis]